MNVLLIRIGWLLGSTAAYGLLAYSVSRQQFGLLIGLLAGLFVGYGFVLLSPPAPFPFWERGESGSPAPLSRFGRGAGGEGRSDEGSLDRFGFGSAVLFRLILLFALPRLSDDVYRFIWDGRLLAHGFNPYLYLPRALVGTNVAAVAGLDETLFGQLNSPGYFTVYPPLNQALFGLAAWLSDGNLLWNVVWLRVPILLGEIGTLWLMPKLLRRLNRNPNLTLLYGLNPLVILELTGNVHFEAVMIYFTLLAAWWFVRGGFVASAGALALAVGTKLLPLLLLPLIIRWLGWKRGLAYAALTGGLTVLLFVPFASLDLIHNVFSSLNLYIRTFEFNASVYYLLRTVGYWVLGYNTIEFMGLSLAGATMLGILWIALRRQSLAISIQILTALTLYYALATTVHPWYVTSLVAASVFTRFRYPLVWSALIPLSYFTYQTGPYRENLWLTAVEYAVVFAVGLWEWRAMTYPNNALKPSKSSAF